MKSRESRYITVAKFANRPTKQALPKYSHAKSLHHFELLQVAAGVLMLFYLDVSYRDIEEWLPLQASIVDANVCFKVGGFAMPESLKGGFEDIHLTRQIAHKYEFLKVPKLVACIRSGDTGSATNFADMFIQNQQSRQKILELPCSYQRLISSARDNPTRNGYWQGKVVYYSLVSAAKKFRARRLFTAGSYMLFALMSLLTAGRYLFRDEFWHAAAKPHFPPVRFAIKDSGKKLLPNTHWNENI